MLKKNSTAGARSKKKYPWYPPFLKELNYL